MVDTALAPCTAGFRLSIRLKAFSSARKAAKEGGKPTNVVGLGLPIRPTSY